MSWDAGNTSRAGGGISCRAKLLVVIVLSACSGAMACGDPARSTRSLQHACVCLGLACTLRRAPRPDRCPLGPLHPVRPQIAERHAAVFLADRTHNLITRLHQNVIRTGLRRINLAYSRISLAEIAAKLHLASAEDAGE